MFKRKKKKTGCETPEFRKPTNPPNVGSGVQHPKQLCHYETPCGWCTKWDKKCDKKIPSKRGKRAEVDIYDEDPWTVYVEKFLVKTY